MIIAARTYTHTLKRTISYVVTMGERGAWMVIRSQGNKTEMYGSEEEEGSVSARLQCDRGHAQNTHEREREAQIKEK